MRLKFLSSGLLIGAIQIIRDTDFITFWNRVQNKPEDAVYMDLKQGLDFLVKDRSVIHISQEMLKGFFLSNPFHNQKLKIFAKEKPGTFL